MLSYPFEFIPTISLLIHLLFKSYGEHQEHRFRFWPAAGSEQPGYRDPDAAAVQALQQAHTQPPPPPPPQPRDRRAEFLRGHPPTFSHTSDPLQADDWLHVVERQLDIASAMIGREFCTQQDSCEGQLWTGGSPTQFRTARLSPDSSSGSASAATTSPRSL